MSFNPLDYPICLNYPKRIAPSTWLSHVPFAMLLVDVLRPKIFVELGTYYGVSYCAFCQAVKLLGINSRCYAIDTWKGDRESEYFGVDILGDLKAYHDPLYADFSRLVQSTFFEASKSFEATSIDLLHIDGFHTYDAVKQDFETWLPKMSQRGVILFHDIDVQERNFGVWKLWKDLKSRYPSFEFHHGCGLGLLAVGDPPPALESFLHANDEECSKLQYFFEELGKWLEKDLGKQTVMTAQRRRILELESFIEMIRRNSVFKVYHWLKYLGKK